MRLIFSTIIVFAAIFLATTLPAHAATDGDMYVFKCTDQHTGLNTIVTWEDVKKDDGLHRLATWKDVYGYHSQVELYVSDSVPNDDGKIVTMWFFHEQNQAGESTGSGLLMNYTKALNRVDYILSNVAVDNHKKVGSQAFSEGECIQTDSSQ